mmetsp:Transcript_50132/g.60506  ORF Transcript_50132/g.60506 Transcript_50132/m.60506 type:complete len:90 (-) Transcript_50132:765-1034(-)
MPMMIKTANPPSGTKMKPVLHPIKQKINEMKTTDTSVIDRCAAPVTNVETEISTRQKRREGTMDRLPRTSTKFPTNLFSDWEKIRRVRE